MNMRLTVCLGAILLGGSLFSQGRENDWQVWLDQSLGYDLDEDLTIRVDQSLRFRRNASELETYTVQVGIQRHARSWIEHGFYIRYLRDRAGEIALNEIRPTYDLVLKWDWGSTRWSNRSRFEYRLREDRDNVFRYRNRLRCVLPWHLTPLKLKPYGAVEVFLNGSEESLLVRNRYRGLIGLQTEPDGFIRKIELESGRRVTSDIYLMYQETLSQDEVVNEYILGFKLGYFF